MEEQSVFYSTTIEIAIILGIAGILSILTRILLRRAAAAPWLKEHTWASALLEVVSRPLHWIIWLSAMLLCVESVIDNLAINDWDMTLRKIRHASIVLIISWLAWCWKQKAEDIILSKRRPKNSMDRATVLSISRLLNVLIVVATLFSLMQVTGVAIATFLAMGGVGAIALTYSSSDIIKNFFGGIIIQTTRPFTVGDWINSPDRQIEGTVEKIGWYQTVIRAFDKRPIYVPNGLFPAIVVRNPSRMSNRRILADIGVRYDDVSKVAKITENIEAMLKAHPAIDVTKTLMIHFTRFGPHSLDLNVYCFTKTCDWAQWRGEQQDVFLKIAEIIEAEGAQIAFPTTVVKLEQEPPGNA